MQKVAVISDIHANLYALMAFIDYVDRDTGISAILNLGDFIQIGPNPAEVFDIVMNDSRFIHIKGNSEQMYFDEKLKQRYASEKAHQEWTEQQLGPDRMKRLSDLPLQRTVLIENKRFLLTHARLNNPADTPILYARESIENFIADYGTDAEYVLIGHTHLPLYAVHWNNRPVINPGSIGCGKDGVARFALLEIDNGLVSVAYKQLRYDKEKLLCDYRDNSVPCREKFISMFY